jgi:hypothetical protein
MRDESSYNAFITGPAADSQKAQKSSRDGAVQACGGEATRRNGGWLPWLDHEFGWTEMTATRFGQMHATIISLIKNCG